MFLRASELLEGPSSGTLRRVQNRSKSMTEGLCKALLLRKRFFDKILGRFRAQFYGF